jgi:hypothetical protein
MVGRDGAIKVLLLTEDMMQGLFFRSRLFNNIENSMGDILCLELFIQSVAAPCRTPSKLSRRQFVTLAASIFHFGEYTVGDVKKYLGTHGVPVRL